MDASDRQVYDAVFKMLQRRIDLHQVINKNSAADEREKRKEKGIFNRSLASKLASRKLTGAAANPKLAERLASRRMANRKLIEKLVASSKR